MTDAAAFLQVGGKVTDEDFSLEKHRVIYRRICDLQDRSENIDRVTLANELMKHGELQSVVGLSYLVSLDDGLPQIHNLDSYVSIIKEKSLLRRIITVSQGLINRCITSAEDPIQILGAAEEALIGLGDVQSRAALSNPAQIIDEFEGGINAFLDTGKGYRHWLFEAGRDDGRPTRGRADYFSGSPRYGQNRFRAEHRAACGHESQKSESRSHLLAGNVERVAVD
jgi:replicative DNA helicase